MNTAIIVAAGNGNRFGGDVPKQFLDLAGKPVIIHTLEKFETCPAIDRIALVLSVDGIKYFKKCARGRNFAKLSHVVLGGPTRAESVRNAIKAISSDDAYIIAVHDGARPLASVEQISQTIEKAVETGASCLVAPVTDTIKEISDGTIARTIDREQLRRAVTPQCFRFYLLQKAFADENFEAEATDECYLVEKLGVEISIVEGSAENIKITTPADIEFAESLLKGATA